MQPKKKINKEYRFDAFSNNEIVLNKKKQRLPAMGWNSWNAFGSQNTEELTKAMAAALVELGLADMGYRYVVLDDGCYRSERVAGRLCNEPVKFPSGFRALSDEIHSKGLKFGMYNDVGTNLCAGAAVGTCGHEATDAASYMEWGIDFLKVDNCYYPWDNATFSDAANARYVFAPNIQGIRIEGEGYVQSLSAIEDGILSGKGGRKTKDYVTGLGTCDGTGPETSPSGEQSSELRFCLTIPKDGVYDISVTYATGEAEGVGEWLQLATGEGEQTRLWYDAFLPKTKTAETFCESEGIRVQLKEGEHWLRLMNHRRQENTLDSYATLLKCLNEANPEHEILFSICEWGKTQPHKWGYKVGDSWRILNDITFQVGADGDPGRGAWSDDYTASVTSQYNKAVIMDEYAGLTKGWNDPDMLMIGMNGLTQTMNRTHFTMWCMMNAPLMLGLDLRRMTKQDALWNIIANQDLIDLNQDALGIQAKRVYCSLCSEHPDTTYIRENHRLDILAKPLCDGGMAISFLNISEYPSAKAQVTAAVLCEFLGHKMVNENQFLNSRSYRVKNLWSKEITINHNGCFQADELKPYDNVTLKIMPMEN